MKTSACEVSAAPHPSDAMHPRSTPSASLQRVERFAAHAEGQQTAAISNALHEPAAGQGRGATR